MLNNIIKLTNKLRYVCLSKKEVEERKKATPHKSQKPKCYSCGCDEVIHSWYAEDEDGNKAHTCSFCLDAYTSWNGMEDTCCETELDFSSKKVLKQFRAVKCEECGRSFITANRSQKICTICESNYNKL